jgi:hypothetical protein
MKRMMVAMLGAVLISAVGVYAHEKPAADGTVFIGCLVPGTTSDAFTLINATEKGKKSKEKATYKVVAESPKVDVDHFVTNEVEITGTVDGSGSSAVLKATKIKRRSDYCG